MDQRRTWGAFACFALILALSILLLFGGCVARYEIKQGRLISKVPHQVGVGIVTDTYLYLGGPSKSETRLSGNIWAAGRTENDIELDPAGQMAVMALIMNEGMTPCQKLNGIMGTFRLMGIRRSDKVGPKGTEH